MICPECGALVLEAIACDLTIRELLLGVECPHCGQVIDWDEWIDPEEEEQQRNDAPA